MKHTLIILAAIILSLPVSAHAYQGHKGEGGPKEGPQCPLPTAYGKGQHHGRPGKANEYRQEVKSKIQEHSKQQKAENKAFQKSLKDAQVPPEERLAAVKEHRQTQYQENIDFFAGIHEENMAQLTEKLAENDKLSEEQKKGIIDQRETQYQENTAFRARQHTENMAFLEQVMGNPDLTPEERKSLMKEHREEQKKENQEYRKAKREENREFRHSWRPKRPEQPVPVETAG